MCVKLHMCLNLYREGASFCLSNSNITFICKKLSSLHLHKTVEMVHLHLIYHCLPFSLWRTAHNLSSLFALFDVHRKVLSARQINTRKNSSKIVSEVPTQCWKMVKVGITRCVYFCFLGLWSLYCPFSVASIMC